MMLLLAAPVLSAAIGPSAQQARLEQHSGGGLF